MKYPIFGNHATSPSNAANSRVPLNIAAAGAAWTTGNDAIRMYFLRPCVLSNFAVKSVGAAGAGGSGDSYTFDIQRNGSNCGLQCVLLETATSDECADGASARFATTDYMYLTSVPNSTPSALTNIKLATMVDTLGDPHVQIWAAYSSMANNATNYMPLMTSGVAGNASKTGATCAHQFGMDGTLKEIRIDIRDTPAAGKTWVATLNVNEVNTGVTVTFNNGDVTKILTGLSQDLTPTDVVCLETVPTGTPTATYFSVCMLVLPDVPGEYPHSGNTTGVNAVSAGWTRISANYASENTTAATNPNQLTPNKLTAQYRKFRSAVSADPGGVGKEWITRMRKNNVNMNDSMTIGNGATTAEDLTNINSCEGLQELSFLIDPNGTPAAILYHKVTCVSFVPPEAPCML